MNAHKYIEHGLQNLESSLRAKGVALNKAANLLAKAGIEFHPGQLEDAFIELAKAESMVSDLMLAAKKLTA